MSKQRLVVRRIPEVGCAVYDQDTGQKVSPPGDSWWPHMRRARQAREELLTERGRTPGMSASARELPPPGETDPVARWKLLGQVSSGPGGREHQARWARYVAAIRRVHGVADDATHDDGQLWTDIRESGLPYAWPYDAGMRRLSCSFCVLASKADLLTACRLRPDVAAQYAAVEARIGHSFQQGRSMASLIAEAGEQR